MAPFPRLKSVDTFLFLKRFKKALLMRSTSITFSRIGLLYGRLGLLSSKICHKSLYVKQTQIENFISLTKYIFIGIDFLPNFQTHLRRGYKFDRLPWAQLSSPGFRSDRLSTFTIISSNCKKSVENWIAIIWRSR